MGQQGPKGAMEHLVELRVQAGWKHRGADWGLQGSVGQYGVVGRARGAVGWAKGDAPLEEPQDVGEAREGHEGVHTGQVHWEG